MSNTGDQRQPSEEPYRQRYEQHAAQMAYQDKSDARREKLREIVSPVQDITRHTGRWLVGSWLSSISGLKGHNCMWQATYKSASFLLSFCFILKPTYINTRKK